MQKYPMSKKSKGSLNDIACGIPKALMLFKKSTAMLIDKDNLGILIF